MKPFYFGRSENSLFGIYHPPLTGHHPGHGIALCYPLGHEYIFGYRAFRQLAVHLARAGFAVLRFDYYGCGDSAGESEEGGIDRWMEDIGTALQELKESGRVSKIYVIGARIGATLSALVGGGRSDIDGMVLWDPITKGKDYVRDLLAQHEQWLMGDGLDKKNHRNREAFGFPLSEGLQESLTQIDLLSMQRRPASRLLIVESDPASPGVALRNHFTGADGSAEYRHVPGPQVWSRKRNGDNALVPLDVLQSIVSWVSGIAK